MKEHKFEKDGILVIGPFTEAIHNTLEEIRDKVSVKDYACICYNAYDFLSTQSHLQYRHKLNYYYDITDEEVKKIGSTFSRTIKRVYGEKRTSLLIERLHKKNIISGYNIFASTLASYKSKFYVIKDISNQSFWITIKDPKAKLAIEKVNKRKHDVNKKSLNLSGFIFDDLIEKLKDDDNYKYILERIDENGIEELFMQKVVRSNFSFYNLIGNLKKDVRKTIRHKTEDVVELDLTAAFPSILPNFITDFLFKYDATYTTKLDRINQTQKLKYKIDRDKLNIELCRYKKENIYTQIQDILGTYKKFFQRDEIKTAYLVFLFADPKNTKKGPPISTYIKLIMRTYYPQIYRSLLAIKHLMTYNKMALHIQSIMSSILKDVIKNVQKENKDCPIIPIYDCIITTKSNANIVKESFKIVLENNDLSHIEIKEKILNDKECPTDNGLKSVSFDYDDLKNNDNQTKGRTTFLVDTFLDKHDIVIKGRYKSQIIQTIHYFLVE